MKEEHISVHARENLAVGTEHELTDHGREILKRWTKSLLESGFGITLPDGTVIDIFSKLKVRAVVRDDVTIGWTARFSGDTGILATLNESHFSSKPEEISNGVFEIYMNTDNIMYGSQDAALNLIKS